MLELDYFLRYRMHCNAQNFITSGKSRVQVLTIERGYLPPVAAAIHGFEALKDGCRQ